MEPLLAHSIRILSVTYTVKAGITACLRACPRALPGRSGLGLCQLQQHACALHSLVVVRPKAARFEMFHVPEVPVSHCESQQQLDVCAKH